MRRHHQRADFAAAGALAFGVAGDHQFLALAALQLDPVAAAAGPIRRVAPLADDALHAQPAGAGDQVVRRFVKRLGQAQRRRLGPPGALQQRLEPGAAFGQRLLAQVGAVQVQQVEQVHHQARAAATVEGVLQRAEVGQAVVARHHHFAIQPGLAHGQGGQGARQLGHARCPVEAIAREQARPAAVDARQQAVAVELQLPQPVGGVGGRLAHQACKLRGGGGGQRHGFRCFRFDSCLRLTGGRWGLIWFGMGGGRLAGLDLRRADRIGQRLGHIELAGGTRHVVAVLDQQPGGFRFAGARLHAHQRPQAGELGAVQAELQLALGQAGARRGYAAGGLPAAAVPDDDAPAAVLPGRNLALEVVVVDRVVFDLHRQPLVARVQARALGHGPAVHGAVQLQPQVVMQARGPVLVDDVLQRALCGRAHGAGRFGRAGEVAPGVVAGEGGAGCRRFNFCSFRRLLGGRWSRFCLVILASLASAAAAGGGRVLGAAARARRAFRRACAGATWLGLWRRGHRRPCRRRPAGCA